MAEWMQPILVFPAVILICIATLAYFAFVSWALRLSKDKLLNFMLFSGSLAIGALVFLVGENVIVATAVAAISFPSVLMLFAWNERSGKIELLRKKQNKIYNRWWW